MRATRPSKAAPSLSHSPESSRRTRLVRVGGLGKREPFGSHSRTLVAPMPQATRPTGTPSRRDSASPKGGRKLPPPPLAPGCGSRAGRQCVPSKVVTHPDWGFWSSSPWLAELDCPVTTNTSPMPKCSMWVWATTESPLRWRTSSRNQPPAGISTEHRNCPVEVGVSLRIQGLGRPSATNRVSRLIAPSTCEPSVPIKVTVPRFMVCR